MQSSEITFGVEIECYVPVAVSRDELARQLTAAGFPAQAVHGDIHVTSTKWKVVHDGSLQRDVPAGFQGLEIVSPVLQGAAGHATMKGVAAVIKATGARVTHRCGFHVHTGARHATTAQLRNVAKMFLRYEKQMDKLCPPSRQNNEFCRSNLATAGGNIAMAFRSIDAARDITGISNVVNGGYGRGYILPRYHRLNMCSYANHGTIEFRQAAGTVEGDKMSAWVTLCCSLVAVAYSVRVVTKAEPATFDDLLAKVPADCASFLRERAQRLAPMRGMPQ